MDRTKGLIREHFTNDDSDGSFKSQRAKCKYCANYISETSFNMYTYFRNCSAVPRRSEGFEGEYPRGSVAVLKPKSLKYMITDGLPAEARKELDYAFVHAINNKALPFETFSTKEFSEFLYMLCGS